MSAIYLHEIKQGGKSLWIWSVCVGGLGLLCILLYSGMRESMEGMAENFASMGAFSDAFGMSQLSIATLAGFYAAEVGTIHALGGAMFAALTAVTMLSKEEEGHTCDFLFALPMSRGQVIAAKGAAVLTELLLFHLVCFGAYEIGFGILGEAIPARTFLPYQAMLLLMEVEIAGICFGISACMRKKKPGLGLGIVLLLYAYDLMARILPKLADYNAVSPFSYANAAELFGEGRVDLTAAAMGAAFLLAGVCTAYLVYTRRDLYS